MKNRLIRCLAMLGVGIICSTVSHALAADPGRLTVKVDQPGARISPGFYGLMTEEINYSYDGGLYGELIQNRIFKNPAAAGRGRRGGNPAAATPAIPHWSVVTSGGAQAAIALDTSNPVNTIALTTSLRLDVSAALPGQRAGVANDGFWGIPAKPNAEYKASFYAKVTPDFTGPLTIDIETNDGATIHASATLRAITTEWKKYELTLKTGPLTSSSTNRFVISTQSPGTLWLNLVSLFPPTYHDRPNGFRPDLMELLAGMKPSFLRFPGGNYLEGPDFDNRFNWKITTGPYENRPGHMSPWRYRSSDGMGLLEFLEWCEDLKMQPVLAVYAGLHIDNGRNIISGDALKPFVQDALDEIEYITGDNSTKWGAARIKDGHLDPFKLPYVEIGNEDNLNNGTPTYNGRFTLFYDAIKAKFPALQIISTMPPGRSGFNLSRRPDLIDDHLYASPAAMRTGSHRFDNYNRANPKIFMGEWASQEGRPTPTFNSALGDAAFLTGLERNADVVQMQCYAPLLVNVNPGGSQWNTNLIGYDALHSFGSPSYYAQKMFSQNRGDRVLPVEIVPQPQPAAVAATMPTGAIGVGTWATNCEYKDIKVTRGDTTLYQSDFTKGIADWKTTAGQWQADEGTLHQSGNATDCRATTGDPAWGDYTYTLKARKLSGAEGFLILFHVKSTDSFIWWNIGGWGNSRTVLEKGESGGKGEFGPVSDITVESNRWYDIRIELKGQTIRCYLDGKLVTEAIDDPAAVGDGLFASASREDASGDVILKVVNALDGPQQLRIDLQGAKQVDPQALVQVLARDPSDVNSLAQPMKVSPQRGRHLRCRRHLRA